MLLDVDSPGGEVGGLFDLADEVFSVREKKPCYAIANDEAFSAAYALASSAHRLFVTSTGGVGSVGVIAIHMDQSGWDEKVGRKYTAVFAGARKNDSRRTSRCRTPPARSSRTRSTGFTRCSWRRWRAAAISPAALVRKTDAGLFWGEKLSAPASRTRSELLTMRWRQ